MKVGQSIAPLMTAEPIPLAAAEGESIRLIAERQHYRLPVVCMLNGEPLLRKDWGHVVTASDDVRFLTFPGGGEGGAKNIFRTVLNIALVLVATYFLGPAGAGLAGWQQRDS